jgi:hypothetical protein
MMSWEKTSLDVSSAKRRKMTRDRDVAGCDDLTGARGGFTTRFACDLQEAMDGELRRAAHREDHHSITANSLGRMVICERTGVSESHVVWAVGSCVRRVVSVSVGSLMEGVRLSKPRRRRHRSRMRGAKQFSADAVGWGGARPSSREAPDPLLPRTFWAGGVLALASCGKAGSFRKRDARGRPLDWWR